MKYFYWAARLCIGTLLLFGSIALFSLHSIALADDSSGAGNLVITLNAPMMDGALSDAYRTYSIKVKRVDRDEVARIRYEQGTVVKSSNDLAASGGNGAVFTKQLSAGDWVVSTFEIDTHSRVRWYPIKELNIPFKIQAGRATYIGSFQPIGYMTKTALGISIAGGVRWVVSDQSARDIPIAQSQNSNLGPVDVGVFDVDTLHHPLLSSHDNASTPLSDDEFGN
jgi:hypothetical protein